MVHGEKDLCACVLRASVYLPESSTLCSPQSTKVGGPLGRSAFRFTVEEEGGASMLFLSGQASSGWREGPRLFGRDPSARPGALSPARLCSSEARPGAPGPVLLAGRV